ncbi:MAG: hypothetical protein IPF87_14315 [Gemmatimonadetes bacterium]|nr:hypothetical protein [Gemmatimonadota bacterium]MBK7830846.1 hypothetical protein [Gemmatimonadota bacterium]
MIQDWLTSFATDLPDTVSLFMAALESFKLFTDRGEAVEQAHSSPKAIQTAYRVFCVLADMAIAVTFEVSVALVAVLLALLVLGPLIVVDRPPRAILTRGLAWAVAAPVLIAVAWTGRGVILSGYPLFPSSVLPFPVDWRAPSEHANCEFAFAAFSARASVDEREVIADETGIEGWFWRWFEESAVADLHLVVIPGLQTLGPGSAFSSGARDIAGAMRHRGCGSSRCRHWWDWWPSSSWPLSLDMDRL